MSSILRRSNNIEFNDYRNSWNVWPPFLTSSTFRFAQVSPHPFMHCRQHFIHTVTKLNSRFNSSISFWKKNNFNFPGFPTRALLQKFAQNPWSSRSFHTASLMGNISDRVGGSPTPINFSKHLKTWICIIWGDLCNEEFGPTSVTNATVFQLNRNSWVISWQVASRPLCSAWLCGNFNLVQSSWIPDPSLGLQDGAK